jgi:ribosomal protein S27AE
MPSKQKMICPKCGGEMNHHSEKVDYTDALQDPERIDPVFGGVLEEIHFCPKCGATASRPAIS